MTGTTILFPFLGNNNIPKLAKLIEKNHSNKNLIYDLRLEKAGLEHCNNMAKKGFFDHYDKYNDTWSNERILLQGFKHPYNLRANSVESLGGGQKNFNSVYNSWLASNGHRDHVLGLGFFSSHTHFGIAHVFDANSLYKHYWAFISAELIE